MVAQDCFVIVAEAQPSRVRALRALLACMCLPQSPGFSDPENSLVPFGKFETIHFARIVVLEDDSLQDRASYPDLPHDEPVYLLLMVDCDGSADALLTRFAAEARLGLEQIFAHCVGFEPGGDLLAWMRKHRKKPSASYVNWVGRSVTQIQEEGRLRQALRTALPEISETEPRKIREELCAAVRSIAPLSPLPETPLTWRLRNIVDLIVPLLAVAGAIILFPLIALPGMVFATCIFLIALRRHEQIDPVIIAPIDKRKIELLRLGEDHDVTNQYSAIGSLKPGRFRRCTALTILRIINWTARHLYARGNLARITSIHFAHWTLLDDNRRLFFASYYDGSHEAYMDDFINKAGFGLNLVFSSGIGYPSTDWLIANGAYREQEFKRFQRHHQIPTDVWYKAYPGLTAFDLARNTRVRAGVEKTDMTDDEIRRWLAEI